MKYTREKGFTYKNKNKKKTKYLFPNTTSCIIFPVLKKFDSTRICDLQSLRTRRSIRENLRTYLGSLGFCIDKAK